VESILRDIYKFYKHSTKRKTALETGARISLEKHHEAQRAIEKLQAEMTESVKIGKPRL
jgi:hypothetical protein